MTAPTLDARTAQTVATTLVADALHLHRNRDRSIEHHGDWWGITGPVRTNDRPGQLDGIVSLTLTDEGSGQQIFVTLMVAAVPLGVTS